MKLFRRWWMLTLLIFAVCTVTLFSNQNTIGDILALHGYSAPSQIAQFESQDTMTAKARHLFEVNHPVVESAASFNAHCSRDNEQALVLGCYLGNRAGIYLYNVTDPQLYGVEQVTAAHEMLHQAYERLSSAKKKQVDAMLQNFFKTGLQDQAVKDQMALYQKTEPDAVVDEMHSVFGTEVAKLPAGLEQYYQQYFTKRSAVTDFYAQYQAPFISRQKQVADDDQQLAMQKMAIDALQASSKAQLAALNAQEADMTQQRDSGNVDAYNQAVPSYNENVNAYNASLADLKQKIEAYNALVSERNAIAVQENQLQQALSSHQLPNAGSK